MNEPRDPTAPKAPLLNALDQELEELHRSRDDADLPATSTIWRNLDVLMTEGEPKDSAPLTVREHRRLRAFEESLAGLGRSNAAVPRPSRTPPPHTLGSSRAGGLKQALALAAALLIGVLATGWWQARARAQWAEQQLLQSTRAAALFGLEHQSAGARLQAVAMTQSTPPRPQAGPDEAILDALLRAVGEDPSDNVRLAAVEALAAWADRPDVASGLIASVPLQRSPAVLWQVAASTLPHADPMQRDRLKQLVAEHEDRLGPDITHELTSLIDDAIPEI